MLRIAVVVGSTRPHRNAEGVARWVLQQARQRSDAEFELVDLKDHPLPMLDEAIPPTAGKYAQEHTKSWAKTIGSFDGFVFVTPEYNHGVPAALKNAIDFVYAEWNNKAAGFVSYGSAGGARAVEHLRGILAELQVATVRAQVLFSLMNDFENYSVLKTPDAGKERLLSTMLDQLVAWSGALRTLRVRAQP
ncbi:MAG TPA: NAD(P)H-dependent oxidoreductase [Thermoplasmata archaeon]|nr:NAD(P)H-dependent oxidoreductase [Thermoplasmata archaeon]HTW77425.1 NAD(P)H-dependent oxidoreductase [Thermoplasmata archaeon]